MHRRHLGFWSTVFFKTHEAKIKNTAKHKYSEQIGNGRPKVTAQ